MDLGKNWDLFFFLEVSAMAQLEYSEYTERALNRSGILAEEIVTAAPKPISKRQFTYYSTLKQRVRQWIAFCSQVNLKMFHRLASTVALPEACKYEIWMLICEIHYFIPKPDDFFEGLMELAIEEKAKFRSFTTAADLRLLLVDLHPGQMTDDSLLKLYLLVRDGWEILQRA